LNRNKQETNRNSLIGSTFCYFLQKMQSFSGFIDFFRFFRFFSVFSVFSFFFGFFDLFRNSLFRLFRFYTETESFIEPKQTEDPPKQFKREYIWKFFQKFRVVSVCFGLLRNRSVSFGCFDIGSKQTEIFSFWFHETNRNKGETDLVLVCFGSNQNLFLFVSRTP
jgi:hypothetical protein